LSSELSDLIQERDGIKKNLQKEYPNASGEQIRILANAAERDLSDKISDTSRSLKEQQAVLNGSLSDAKFQFDLVKEQSSQQRQSALDSFEMTSHVFEKQYSAISNQLNRKQQEYLQNQSFSNKVSLANLQQQQAIEMINYKQQMEEGRQRPLGSASIGKNTTALYDIMTGEIVSTI